MIDRKRHTPAAQRNRRPILEVLRRQLPESGQVLEVASGTGEHVAFFARQLPQLTWLPSDASSDQLESIDAWVEDVALRNLRKPVPLDVTDDRWPVEAADAVIAINLLHISPWQACEGLFAGAARILRAGATVFIYGAFNIDGEFTAPSNERFDSLLRRQDPRWGVRDLEAVGAVAEAAGFSLAERVAMPANNLSLIFRRM